PAAHTGSILLSDRCPAVLASSYLNRDPGLAIRFRTTAFWDLPTGLDSVLGILFIEPFFQRCKVVEDGSCIHLPFSGQSIKFLRPWLALSHFEHLAKTLTGNRVLVDRAAMQRTGVTDGAAQPAMKLELENSGEEVAGVRSVSGNMRLCAGIKVCLRAGCRSRDP